MSIYKEVLPPEQYVGHKVCLWHKRHSTDPITFKTWALCVSTYAPDCIELLYAKSEWPNGEVCTSSLCGISLSSPVLLHIEICDRMTPDQIYDSLLL